MPKTKKAPPVAAAQASTASEDPLPHEVLRQFRQIYGAVRRHFREVEKGAGLGGAQVWALSCIRDRPGIGVTELAAAMDIHQSTASNLVRGLRTRALIRNEQGTQDRRAVKLWILPAGRAILRRVPQPHSGLLPKALAELEPQALLRLRKDLAVLIERLGVDDESAGTPLAQL